VVLLNQEEAAEFAETLDTEAGWAMELWSSTWPSSTGDLNKDDRLKNLHTAALALNALGNMRLAQAIVHQQQNIGP
jgi:hypothetical protein